MCVVRGDGGGRLRSGLISVPGSDSASSPGPTGEMLPACSSAGTGHAHRCPQQERTHGWPRAPPKPALQGAAAEHPALHPGFLEHAGVARRGLIPVPTRCCARGCGPFLWLGKDFGRVSPHCDPPPPRPFSSIPLQAPMSP